MNNYNLKCYKKTYNDPKFWDGIQLRSNRERQKTWGDCREITDRFYDELIYRGYLIPKSKP